MIGDCHLCALLDHLGNLLQSDVVLGFHIVELAVGVTFDLGHRDFLLAMGNSEIGNSEMGNSEIGNSEIGNSEMGNSEIGNLRRKR